MNSFNYDSDLNIDDLEEVIALLATYHNEIERRTLDLLNISENNIEVKKLLDKYGLIIKEIDWMNYNYSAFFTDEMEEEAQILMIMANRENKNRYASWRLIDLAFPIVRKTYFIKKTLFDINKMDLNEFFSMMIINIFKLIEQQKKFFFYSLKYEMEMINYSLYKERNLGVIPSYIFYYKYVEPLENEIKEYSESHLGETPSIEYLCEKFNITKQRAEYLCNLLNRKVVALDYSELNENKICSENLESDYFCNSDAISQDVNDAIASLTIPMQHVIKHYFKFEGYQYNKRDFIKKYKMYKSVYEDLYKKAIPLLKEYLTNVQPINA